jgi:hypothetical protein
VTRARRAVIAGLLASLALRARAQDTTVIVLPHRLVTDTTGIAPFHRSYDMLVYVGDSAVFIGDREVSLDTGTYGGVPSWLLVETRSGSVPAAESLYLARDLRPLHWSSALGLARLGVEFARDTIYGVTTSPLGRQNIVIAGRSDLLVSTAMTEAVLAALPLAVGYHDSTAVLDVSLTNSSWSGAELSVVGEEELLDAGTLRSSWVVALRREDRQALFWVEKSSRATLRVLHMLPPHVGRQLEYRIRSSPSAR